MKRRGSSPNPSPVSARRWSWLAGTALTLAVSGACTTENPGFCTDSPECEVDLAAAPDLATSEPPDMARPAEDAAPSTPFDPNKAGTSYIVIFDQTVQVSMRSSVETTIIGPSEDSIEISKKGPFPVVVISPGFTLDRKLYQSYAERLASYGIIAVLQKSRSEWTHTQYRDETIALLDWVINPTGFGASRLAGRVDKNRVGLAGHSLGGKISLMVAAKDPRIKALFAIDPVDAGFPQARGELGNIKLAPEIPMAFIGETVSKMGSFMPCAPADSNFEVLYGRAPAPALSITFKDAAHNDFVDNFMNCMTCSFCPGGTAPKDRTNKLAVKYSTAYFVWALKGDKRGADYLTGAELQKDVAMGYVTGAKK
jgi:predicted dienelactone hydrolase